MSNIDLAVVELEKVTDTLRNINVSSSSERENKKEKIIKITRSSFNDNDDILKKIFTNSYKPNSFLYEINPVVSRSLLCYDFHSDILGGVVKIDGKICLTPPNIHVTINILGEDFVIDGNPFDGVYLTIDFDTFFLKIKGKIGFIVVDKVLYFEYDLVINGVKFKGRVPIIHI